MSITPADPGAPRPLSERERRILAGIGDDLAAESPELGERLAALPEQPVRRRGGIVDDVLATLAVLVVLGVLLPSAWFATVLLVVVMAGPALLAARFLPPSSAADDAGTDRSDQD